MAKTLNDFFEWCKTANVAAPMVTMWTRTEPKPNIIKISEKKGQIGCSYENCVKNKTGDETFVAESLWKGKGAHVPGNRYLVTHKEKGGFYIQFRPSDVSVSVDIYKDKESGQVIERPDLPEKPEVVQQWRTIKLENVLQIKCGDIYENKSN